MATLITDGGRNRQRKQLTLSARVKSYLDEHDNASLLVDRLVDEHIDEQRGEIDDMASALDAVEQLDESTDYELDATRAGVRYAAKRAGVTPEELLDEYRGSQ